MNQTYIIIGLSITIIGYVFYRYMWPQVKEVQQIIQEMQDNKEKVDEEVKDE